jgi:hypothetical protein
MATASPPAAAPAKMPRVSWLALVRVLPATITITGIAALTRLVYDPWYLNYDARYALLWARDVWHGFMPDFQADFAPTPHPLSTLVSSVGLPFGHDGDVVVVWMVLLSFGALVWLVYRLGETLFSSWVGIVAAVVVLTRPVLERDVLLGYQDVPFAALVVGAVLLEAQRRRRGLPVLALLALAGLLRPEAWVVSAAYLLWMWRGAAPRARVWLAAAAASAPVLWVVMDWIVTGDPLHSLHGTADLAEQVKRRRDLTQVPFWSLKYFGYTLREPLLVGIPIGLAFAWRHRRGRAALPVAAALAMTLFFAIGPIFGLPLIGRYIRTPAVLLTLFFGVALCGWTCLPKGRERNWWLAGAAVTAIAFLAYLPSNVGRLDALRTRSAREGALYTDLRRVGEDLRVRTAFAKCAPLAAADHRPVPYIRFWLGGAPDSVSTVEDGARPPGRMLLVPRRNEATTRFYRAGFPSHVAPTSYQRVYENPTWRVYAARGC